MNLSEIEKIVEGGEPINPLEWPVEDRYRYCLLSLTAVYDEIHRLLTEYLGASGDFEEDNDKVCVGLAREDMADTRQEMYGMWDRMMLIAHNVHTLFASALTQEQMAEETRKKIEVMTGQAIVQVGQFGNLAIFQADTIPDDLSGLSNDESC
jgi:hypothetical protein